MALPILLLARTVIRRWALDDLRVTLLAAALAMRLLLLASRCPVERRRAARLVLLLEDARSVIDGM